MLDFPKCDHDQLEVMVTNQPDKFDSSRPHRSAWVCNNTVCIADAIAWVMLGTGEKAYYKLGVEGEWVELLPEVEDE